MGLILQGQLPTLTVGGRVFTDLANLITLFAYCSGPANTNATFRKPFASSGYTPSGSKTFKICAIKSWTDTASPAIRPLYSDNDVGFASASAFTNAVYVNGNSNVGMAYFGQSVSTLPQFIEIAFGDSVIVPNGKYVSMYQPTNAITSHQLYGYEV